MRWEVEEVEAALERIWGLHDRISDAIHAISRSHFLKSVHSNRRRTSPEWNRAEVAENGGGGGGGGDEGVNGFVFVKDFRTEGEAAMAEARSLHAIRTALENLEDQLEFFHIVQSQQRVERDAAIARLEQSRIILAMQLADHQGKKCRVIEEAAAFVGDTCCFISPEALHEMPTNHSDENLGDLGDHERKRPSVLMQVVLSGLQLVRNSLKLETAGVLGNAALFAATMLALLQLHHATCKGGTSIVIPWDFRRKINSQPESIFKRNRNNFDVFSARG